MAAFELNSEAARRIEHNEHELSRLREEPIIANKIYDSCRQQDCLTHKELGPARAAEHVCIDSDLLREGDIIVPPGDAASVTIDNLRIKKIIVVDKKMSPFKSGYWDVDIKFVFEYVLTFREADGDVIVCVKANSIFNKKVTLFGSTGSELVIGTDLHKHMHSHEASTINAVEPFVWVEAKAVALAAEIRYNDCHSAEDHRRPKDVIVTIGLFSIIDLFRIVNLRVESRGFSVPRECDGHDSTNPCEFFDNLDFPMDIFAPPQRPEFLAGISGNIPRGGRVTQHSE